MPSRITRWKFGPPQTEGIFWYDSGLWLKEDKHKYPFVAQSWMFEDELHTHLFADCGSGPLSMVYNKKVFKKHKLQSRHALIPPPSKKWIEVDLVRKKKNVRRAWVKSPKGYIGLAILRSGGWFYDADIVWKNHPTDGSACGTWFRPEDNYLFSIIREPKIIR